LKKSRDKNVHASEKNEKEEKYYCSVCGREISKEEYKSFDDMCWKCWGDQFTEASETMFGGCNLEERAYLVY